MFVFLFLGDFTLYARDCHHMQVYFILYLYRNKRRTHTIKLGKYIFKNIEFIANFTVYSILYNYIFNILIRSNTNTTLRMHVWAACGIGNVDTRSQF